MSLTLSLIEECVFSAIFSAIDFLFIYFIFAQYNFNNLDVGVYFTISLYFLSLETAIPDVINALI